jgi:hypothetical protein
MIRTTGGAMIMDIRPAVKEPLASKLDEYFLMFIGYKKVAEMTGLGFIADWLKMILHGAPNDFIWCTKGKRIPLVVNHVHYVKPYCLIDLQKTPM